MGNKIARLRTGAGPGCRTRRRGRRKEDIFESLVRRCQAVRGRLLQPNVMRLNFFQYLQVRVYLLLVCLVLIQRVQWRVQR